MENKKYDNNCLATKMCGSLTLKVNFNQNKKLRKTQKNKKKL